MKKFLKNLFACFIILLIFGGVLFFLGWTQFKVPVNGFGILISKTGGIAKEPVKSGVFSWHWEFLIPTNAELKTFKPENFSYAKKITGQLASGDFYSGSNRKNVDFSYSFDFNIVCKVEPENIIKLFSESRISDEDSLKQFVYSACDEACQMIVSEYFKKLETDRKILPESMSSQDYLKLVNLSDSFPYIDFLNFSVFNVRLPDYGLYEKLRTKVLSSIDTSLEEDFVSEDVDISLEEKTEPEVIKNVEKDNSPSEEDIKFLNKLKSLLSSAS